jgi:hypothetical protein
MRDPFRRRFALAALVAARLNHCRNRLKAVLDPVGQLLHQHADTLVRDHVLAFEPRALRGVFDRQEDL